MNVLQKPRVTPREQEILALVAAGHGNAAIAEILTISLQTVRTHRKNAMRKLGLHNAAAVTAHIIHSAHSNAAKLRA